MEKFQLIGMIIGWILAILLVIDKLFWSKKIREAKDAVIEGLKNELAFKESIIKNLENQLNPSYQISMISNNKELQQLVVEKIKEVKSKNDEFEYITSKMKELQLKYEEEMDFVIGEKDFSEEYMIGWLSNIVNLFRGCLEKDTASFVTLEISIFSPIIYLLNQCDLNEFNLLSFCELKHNYNKFISDAKEENSLLIQ